MKGSDFNKSVGIFQNKNSNSEQRMAQLRAMAAITKNLPSHRTEYTMLQTAGRKFHPPTQPPLVKGIHGKNQMLKQQFVLGTENNSVLLCKV